MANDKRNYRGRGAYGDGFASDIYDALGGYAWTDEQATGNGPTEMDMMNWAYDEYSRNQQNQWQQNMYMEDRAWQEEMYERYQSIGGQIDQMRAAGLNPALMYQGAGTPPAVQSGQMPSSGSGSSPNGGSPTPPNGLQQAMNVVQSILGFANVASALGTNISQIKRNAELNKVSQAEAENLKSQTANNVEERWRIIEQTHGLYLENEYKEIRNRYAEASYELENEETRKRIDNLVKDLEVKDNQIKLGRSQFNLNVQYLSESEQRILNMQVEHAIKRLDAKRLNTLLPLVERCEIARAELLEAQGAEAEAKATEALRKADVYFWDAFIKGSMNDPVDTYGGKPFWQLLMDEKHQQLWLNEVRQGTDIASVILKFIGDVI